MARRLASEPCDAYLTPYTLLPTLYFMQPTMKGNHAMTTNISNTANTIDVRDIIARYEELERGTIGYTLNALDAEEFTSLAALLTKLSGNGGDEQWRGDWYPLTLIRDSHFDKAMDEMLEECGEMPKNLPCYLRITVDYIALQMDYASIEYDGEMYWYR